MKARIPQGMGPNNMSNMLKQAQKMQEDAAALQAELDEREYTASSGGGMVEVTVTVKHQVRSIRIQPDAVDPEDIEMLEDLLCAALNQANTEADETAAAEMEKVTGSLNLPNIPGMEGLF